MLRVVFAQVCHQPTSAPGLEYGGEKSIQAMSEFSWILRGHQLALNNTVIMDIIHSVQSPHSILSVGVQSE